MPKNNCPTCEGLKDKRATTCLPCRPPKKSTWRIHSSGYVRKSVNGQYVYQHRVVMEEYLGRSLETYEHVHHINHNRADNRIENLEILTHSEHAKNHLTPDRAKEMSIKGHEARWNYKEV